VGKEFFTSANILKDARALFAADQIGDGLDFPSQPAGAAIRLSSMKSARDFAVVLVTAPGLRVARKLARDALETRLIACANLISGVESHYLWRGKIERGAEVLMLLKTSRRKLRKLEAFIKAIHPYSTPEFLVLNPARGSEIYLRWLDDSLNPG